jgi:hypothetical protein
MKIEKKELIEQIKKEMLQNYVRFSKFDSAILPHYEKEWKQAVQEFYEDYKGGFSKFQQDWNIHCNFIKILEQ